uniref:RNA polymerase II-associated protein 3 n=3 Tax=Bombyx mori TaxID=7091 RepID=A0A8R2R2J7_BOMMO|nr:TPR-repeat protein isoform X1 [Bombyx mori]
MEKAFEVQKQVRDNAKTVQSYMSDLLNWETEMKRKEAAINGQYEQDLPPVRSKIKKDKPLVAKKKQDKRISASDYQAWEKFDADKACKDVEIADIGPASLDGKMSQQVKQEKLREEAQYEKERGNTFVKQEKWDEAISCYNRAIELVKDDAIYFANRGFCYLKKDSLHQAEADCTEALRLDPTYVKALQRRATARERLGSLRSASQDLAQVLQIEPHNSAARKQLDAIRARMGTKGTKSKSSPLSTPMMEAKPVSPKCSEQKIVQVSNDVTEQQEPIVDTWREGVGEAITVLKPVKKPPHLRSKRQLKTIPIHEIQLGKTTEKLLSHLNLIENEVNQPDETVNNESNKTGTVNDKGAGDISSPESVKLISEAVATEKDVQKLVAPVNSVQFMSQWKYLKGQDEIRSYYLSIIEPSRIPSMFANALESDVLSELIRALHDHAPSFRHRTVAAYLTALTQVKRFSALAMFLSAADKRHLKNLLEYCRNEEKCSEQDIAELTEKYEL